MIFISLLLFFLIPLLSLPFILSFYFIDNNKKGIVYSILIGIAIGIIAYYFIPPMNYDLYRHHLAVNRLIGIDFKTFIKNIDIFSIELLPQFINYFAARLLNHNLIQLFIVSLGYTLLSYIMYDYNKRVNCNVFIFIIMYLFIMLGLNFIYFISGLWFYIAVIIFAFAYYLEKVKNINKIICYILYFITILFHKSLLFAILLLIIYKLFNEKINLRIIIIALLVFLLPQVILNYLSKMFNSGFLNTINNMFNSYTLRNAEMYNHYGTRVLIIEFSKILITMIFVFFERKNEKLKQINGFIFLLSICTLLMFSKSVVMIRFAMLIQFIGIIPIMSNLKKLTKNNFLVILIMIVLMGFYTYYLNIMLQNQKFGNLNNNINKNIIEIFKER